jgi:hypothetical protein
MVFRLLLGLRLPPEHPGSGDVSVFAEEVVRAGILPRLDEVEICIFPNLCLTEQFWISVYDWK